MTPKTEKALWYMRHQQIWEKIMNQTKQMTTKKHTGSAA